MLMHGCVKGQSDLRGPKFAGSALIRREDQNNVAVHCLF